jgi:hypothetical protein
MLARVAEFIGHVSDKRSTSILFSLGIMVFFGLFAFVVSFSLSLADVSRDIQGAVQAGIVGTGTGITSYLLLAARRERRIMVREELSRVAELNHHLRNSLQIIVGAHYIAKDEEHTRMMMETVHTIDDMLKRLFPAAGIERRATTRASKDVLDSLRRSDPPPGGFAQNRPSRS